MTRKIEFDLKQVHGLCKLMATQEEIAAYFSVSVRTVADRMANEPDFKKAMEDGYAEGRLRLRRWQMRAAMKGNAAMLIFLGKNLLGQKDVVDAFHSGTVTQEFTIKAPHEYRLPQTRLIPETIEGAISPEALRINRSDYEGR